MLDRVTKAFFIVHGTMLKGATSPDRLSAIKMQRRAAFCCNIADERR